MCRFKTVGNNSKTKLLRYHPRLTKIDKKSGELASVCEVAATLFVIFKRCISEISLLVSPLYAHKQHHK